MEALERAVGAALGSAVVSSAAVHGGDVAAAYRMDLADGRRVFAKTHHRPPAGFFTTEAAGLR
jgi:fructosamine-3-kinase